MGGGAGAERRGIVEVAVGGVAPEAEEGRRGDAGGPPGGAGRLGVAARGGASARSASGGRRGRGEAQHGDGAADGGGAASQEGLCAGEGARCPLGRGAEPSQGPHRGGRGHPGAAAAVEQGPAPVAAAEGDDRISDAGEGPARQEGAGGAAADRAPRRPVGEASRVAIGAAQGGVPRRVRAAGAAAFGAAAGPAARRARPRPHGAPGARGTRRGAQPAVRCAGVPGLRKPVRGQRRRGVGLGRDRGQCAPPGDPPPALAADMRVRVVARRGDGAPGAPAVRPHAVRDERLVALPVRALRVPAPPAPGLRVAVGPRAAGLAGHAGGQRAPLRAVVRAGGRGDPRAPERRVAAPRRRDQLAGAGVARGGRIGVRVAVDFGRSRRGPLPRRSVTQRRCGHEAVRRDEVPDGPRLRPLQQLQEAGASPRGQGDPVVLLGAHAQGLHPVRGRTSRSGRLVPRVARADRDGLPPAQGRGWSSTTPASSARRRRSTRRTTR